MLSEKIKEIPKDLNQALDISIAKYEKFLEMFRKHDLHVCFDRAEISWDYCGLCTFFRCPDPDCEECPIYDYGNHDFDKDGNEKEGECSVYWEGIYSMLYAFFMEKEFFSWSVLIDQTEKLIQQMKEAKDF